ncbi:MAG: dUTP diphosphatase [bacterium]
MPRRLIRLPVPLAATADAAGLDPRAAVRALGRARAGGSGRHPLRLRAGPAPDHEGQVRPRSGRALREGLTVLNAPGTVDADYRGELRVLLVNLGQAPVTIQRGERIAQLVVAPVRRVAGREVAALPATARARAVSVTPVTAEGMVLEGSTTVC